MSGEVLYQDNYVQLIHGDALQVSEWLAADVLVTDPPYGQAHKPRSTYVPATGETRRSALERIAGDESIEARDEVLQLWSGRGGGAAMIFGTWRQPRPPLDIKHRLIWWKQGQAPGPTRAAFMIQDEEIYVVGGGFVESSPPKRSVFPTNEFRPAEVARIGHPTPKPIQLMEWLIERCQPDWIIADPFAGSGSTLIAARNLGRRAIGVEINREYAEIAAGRLSNQPLFIEGGQDEH